jgi:hypothetical protein
MAEAERKTSPQAVLLFLKAAGLEPQWTTEYAAQALGIGRATAKEVTAELALMGYAEPVKRDTWRNTSAGNKVAGVRPARLTRAKAEELLIDVGNRAADFNAQDGHTLRIVRIVAVGGFLTKHDPIQDIDVLVQFEDKPGATASTKDHRTLLQALKGRSPALTLHVWEPGFTNLLSRVVWEA